MIEKRGEGENIFAGREQFTPWAKAMAYSRLFAKNTALISRFSGGIYNGFNNASLNKRP